MALTKFWFSTPTSTDGNTADRPNCLLVSSVPSWDAATNDQMQQIQTNATLSFRNASNVQQQLVTINTPRIGDDTDGKIDTTFSLNAITFRKVVLTYGSFVATFTSASDITTNASAISRFICGYHNAQYDIGDEFYEPFADFMWNTVVQPNVRTEGNLILDVVPSTVTVTYNANGGSVTPASSTVNAGSPVTTPTPTRAGYNCTGWYTASSGGTKRCDAGASYTPTASETIYAQWQLITYRISFNANGGSGTTNYIDTATYAPAPASNFTPPSGTQFLYWCSTADGSGVQYYVNDNIPASGNITSNITLYAIWGSLNDLHIHAGTYNGTTLSTTINASSANKIWLHGDVVFNTNDLIIDTNVDIEGFAKKRLLVASGRVHSWNGTSVSWNNDAGATVQIGVVFLNFRKISNIVISGGMKTTSHPTYSNTYIHQDAILDELGCWFDNCMFDYLFTMGGIHFSYGGTFNWDTVYFEPHYNGMKFTNCRFFGDVTFIGDYLEITNNTLPEQCSLDASYSIFTDNVMQNDGGVYSAWTGLRVSPSRRRKSLYQNTVARNTLNNMNKEEAISVDFRSYGIAGKITDITGNVITYTPFDGQTPNQVLRVGQTCTIVTGIVGGQYYPITDVTQTSNSVSVTVDTSTWDLIGVDVGDIVKSHIAFTENQISSNTVNMNCNVYSNAFAYRTGVSLYGDTCGNTVQDNTIQVIYQDEENVTVGFQDNVLTLFDANGLSFGTSSRNSYISNETIACDRSMTISPARFMFKPFSPQYGITIASDALVTKSHLAHYYPSVDQDIIRGHIGMTVSGHISNGSRVLIVECDDLVYTGDIDVDTTWVRTPTYGPPFSGLEGGAINVFGLDYLWNTGAYVASDPASPTAIQEYAEILSLASDMSWINPYFTRTFTGDLLTEPDIKWFLAIAPDVSYENEISTGRVSIYYNANGGSGLTPSSQTFKSTYTIKDGSTLYQGTKSFVGWSTSPTGAVEYLPNDIISPETDVTLYAIYGLAALPLYVNGKQVLEMYAGGKRVLKMYVDGKTVFE